MSDVFESDTNDPTNSGLEKTSTREEQKKDVEIVADSTDLNKSIKELSISSIESLSSENNKTAISTVTKHEPTVASNSKQHQEQQQENIAYEYDYIKAGAKPKNTLANRHATMALSSSSCSSSLSSLVSQTTNSSSSAATKSSHLGRTRPSINATSSLIETTLTPHVSTNNLDIILIDDNEMNNQQDEQQQTTKCPLCMKSIGDYDLEAHFQLEHREYECPFCGLLFDSDVSMNTHLSSVHSETTTSVGTSSRPTIPESMSRFGLMSSDGGDGLDVFEHPDDAKYTCPVCDLRLQDEVWLEIHVETHFNPSTDNVIEASAFSSSKNTSNTNKTPASDAPSIYGSNNAPMGSLSMDVNRASMSSADLSGNGAVVARDRGDLNSLLMGATAVSIGSMPSMKSRSRANSASSVTANVDENLELDQMIILSEYNNSMMDFDECQNGKSNIATAASAAASSRIDDMATSNDYQIALILEKEERENFFKRQHETSQLSEIINKNVKLSSADFVRAQMLERAQNEAAKYKVSKENIADEDDDEAVAYSIMSNLSDSENYSHELEHEWLRQRYGMSDTMNAASRAIMNLDRAKRTQRIDHLTYETEKARIHEQIERVYDDGSTGSNDLIDLIKSIPLGKVVNQRVLCSKCTHYASGFIDAGYGCGYRNTQMLLSSIRHDPLVGPVVFNNNNLNMPSVSKIQQLIENAWRLGFDVMGQAQLGGVLYKTAKWIGASDVAAMFLSLRIKIELVDIKPKQENVNKSVGKLLYEFVKNYFQQESNSGRHIHPIYLQHEGHSRTIVGYEEGKCQSLLIFDPATRKTTIDQNRSARNKLLNLFRKNVSIFDKKREYQLLIIRGVIKSDEEYNRSKILQSTMIS